MKVINYKYGYIPRFSCSISGKIAMTNDEWQNASRYLRSKSVMRSFLPSYPWTNTMLIEDIERKVSTKSGYRINIRVPMTEKLAQHYHLKIKRANYMIEVTA
jgi:peptidoglycan hydrolase-like amidase